jgi:aryl-alcohol dehydrogenase-like predicted oxidoreductase
MKIPAIPVALGTATYGTSVPEHAAFDLLGAFAGLGGTVLDTANNYAFWHADGVGGDSETVLGNWLQTQDRTAFTVITKVGSQPSRDDKDVEHLEGLSSAAVRRAVDRSLARLRTDCLDVLLAHHDDLDTPLLDTWRAFTQLVEQGTVKRVGISNYHPERIIELTRLIGEHGLAPISAVQLKYSVLPPLPGVDFGKLVVLDNNLRQILSASVPQATVYGYAPLLGGLFERDPFGDGKDHPWPAAYDSPQNRQQVEEIRQAAADADVSASAWVLQSVVQQGIIPVTSTRSLARLESNLDLVRNLSWPAPLP